MPDKELIKQEIERRIKNLEFSLENNCIEKYFKLDILGNITTLNSLLQFIDSLPEEPTSKDLEEAAFKYRCEHNSCDAYTIDSFKAGANWQKQQMMKDAVDAFVNTYENSDNSNYVEFVTEQSPYKFKETEKCKIIIVKEEQQ